MASEEQKQKQSMAEGREPQNWEGEGGSASLMEKIGFMFLIFSSAMAVSLWHRGFGALSFLVFFCMDLAMLFHCLRLYARTPPGSPRRELLKMEMCLLATMLTVTIFQLLELWFLTIGKTPSDFQNHAASVLFYA